MINTELYRIFYYVAISKNISKAAVKLYITQPAVSKSIKKLEELSGCTLFIRSSKGVILTSEGEIIFEYVQRAFKELLSGEKIIEKLNNRTEGIVKIGISNTLCKYFFLPLLERFHKRYPGIRIQIINRPSPETYALVHEGKADFGIISIPENKLSYKYIPLMRVHDIFVIANNDEIEDKAFSIKDLEKFPLMMMENGNQTRIYVDKFLEEENIQINPEIEIGSMDFLIEFAKIGLGVACVIKEFVVDELKEGTLKELPLKKSPRPREIGILLKENFPLSIAAKTFVEFLRESAE